MSQYSNLRRKTQNNIQATISVLPSYKDNSTPITISASGQSYMKVWITSSATGSTSDSNFPSTWIPYSSSWTPNFSTEGTMYVHAIFQDNVNNDSDIFDSTATIFDKTAPTVTGVSIANNADIIVNRTAVVRVTASDNVGGSGIQKTNLSGDLDPNSDTEFIWSAADRAEGFKDCTVVLTANTDPSHREAKVVYATATDNAGNTSERNSDTVILYTGGIDPVIVLKTPTDAVIGKHYGNKPFKLQLQVITGITDLLSGYMVYGDFSDTDGSTDPTAEPVDFTTWPTGQSLVSLDRYLTAIDGNKTIRGKVKLIVSSITDTVATVNDLPATANDGEFYVVTTDADHNNETSVYRYSATDNEFEYYGKQDGAGFAIKELELTTVHHSEAVPTIVLTSNKAVISDKTNFDTATLTAAMTTSCNINEYKVVAYASAEAATAGTEADVTNVELSGTIEIVSGNSWSPDLLENKLKLAIPGEGQKFIVVYAKNLCDKWGKSNTLTISIDETAPIGTVAVNQYYNTNSGFVASATDTGSSVAKMQAWVDSSAGTTEPPVTSTEYDYATNLTAAQVDWTGKAQGNCYVHIKYTDAVGNSGITHSTAFIYDDVPPTGSSVSAPARTNTTTISLTLASSDVTSGMGMMKIFGDVNGASTAEQAEWIQYATGANITLTNTDGTKTINVLFKDNAGNVIASAVSCTTILDTTAPHVDVVLYKNDDSAVLPNHVNTVNFKAHITGTDVTSPVTHYKAYGDITSAATEQEAEWVPYSVVEPATYLIASLALTTGDGLKTIKFKIKDEAGNISAETSATVTLDTTAPEINIAGQDYNIISNKHLPRKSGITEIAGTFSDMMSFNFSCGSILAEWKVCVNAPNQTASAAVAIGTSGGSINMTGTNLAANTTVNCVIMEADFAAHPVVNDTDGLYEFIVYGKDEAGNWSPIHIIEAARQD